MKIKLDRYIVLGIWTLIILSTLFHNDLFMYVALVVSTAALVYYIYKCGYKLPKKINIGFACMVCIYFVGLLRHLTVISIRNIVSLFAIIIVFNLLSLVAESDYSAAYIVLTLSLLLIVCLFSFVGTLDNTSSGIVVFCTMCAIMHLFFKRNDKNGFVKRKILWLIGIFCFVMAEYLAYRERARTALLVGAVIVCVYIVLKCLKIKDCYTKREFYLLVLIGIVAISIYTFISAFDWYDAVNRYSVAWFGKNIDSSRPRLWRESFVALRGNVFLGLGTGIQPTDINIPFDSFHNSFIQLLVQNGFFALCGLIYILSEIWVVLRARIEDDEVKFAMACLVGVMVYNCFETTLLSNKLTLGIAQWIIVAAGYARAKRGMKIHREQKGAEGSINT